MWVSREKARLEIYMKFTLIIDEERDEECLVYAKEKTELVEKLEALAKSNQSTELLGFSERGEIVPLDTWEVQFFAVREGKVYASCDSGELRLRQRLYEIEELLPPGFVKINQSCIANIKKIKKFDASLAGSLIVIFENGERDYVSRRQLKAVKERIGL
jgi:DNA-binding LytR/AlgR family response regulator